MHELPDNSKNPTLYVIPVYITQPEFLSLDIKEHPHYYSLSRRTGLLISDANLTL